MLPTTMNTRKATLPINICDGVSREALLPNMDFNTGGNGWLESTLSMTNLTGNGFDTSNKIAIMLKQASRKSLPLYRLT